MSREFRHVRLSGAVGAELRTGQYDGREHLIVPVVALMEGVIWASNAPGREYVPRECLARAPQAWDGEPVMLDHPTSVDGVRLSANSPEVLAASCFGRVFNSCSPDAVLATGRLALEAWLDPVRAGLVGADAEDVIDRVRKNELVEVSIGAFVLTRKVAGVHDGVEYVAEWEEVFPDHLAMLPRGVTGACSVDMGCGAPRTARHFITASGIVIEPQPAAEESHMDKPAAAPAATPPAPDAGLPTTRRGLRERLRSLFAATRSALSDIRGAAEDGLSDADLRGMLHDAIRAVEPGYLWVEEVFPEAQKVIYCVDPDGSYHTVRRGYAVDGLAVSLLEDREEVTRVTSYEPVTAAADQPATATPKSAACGCGGNAHQPATPATAEGVNQMDKKDRVKALIDNPKTSYSAAHQAWLEAAPEDMLKAIEDEAAAKSAAPAAPPAPAPAEAAAPAAPATASAPAAPAPVAPKPKTEAEWLAEAPADIRDMVARQREAETARKEHLVGVLKDAQAEYTEAELKAMSLGDLERTARLVDAEPACAGNVVDFTGRGMARAAAARDEDVYTKPASPWDVAAQGKGN